MSSESTQPTMDRVMQQLNSQGLRNIINSTDDNPYNFTDLHCNIDTLNNKEILDNVVQETPCGIIFDSQEIIGQEGMDFYQSITILKTQRTIHEFKLDKRVELLHHIDDTIVTIAKISSIAAVDQLHNRLQPEDYYKVSIQDAIVDDTPLMITNIDDDPPQLFVQNAIGTMTAWKWDRIRSMLEI